MGFRDSAEDLLAARAAKARVAVAVAREQDQVELAAREFQEERAARLAATASPEEAAASIVWLLDRLEEQLRWASDQFRRFEVQSQILLVRQHQPVAVSEMDQRVWGCRAKCGDESWTSREDTELVVQSPCVPVKLIARPYALVMEDTFPAVLRLADDEEG